MTVDIRIGDCREILPTIEAETVDCAVTSPPYFGQRDYGVDGQIGLEHTPDEYAMALVAVFREVMRTLKPEGTLWLNIGDTYCNAKGASHGKDDKQKARRFGLRPQDRRLPGIKPKDLIGIPWLVAFALQRHGWYLRDEIIWVKPDPVPDRSADRLTFSHEKIFMFSKSRRYYFDAAALEIPAKQGGMKNGHNVWTVPVNRIASTHAATFPIEIPRRCISAGTPAGGVVLDPFGGTGTTAVAAHQIGRSAIVCELNEGFAGLAAKSVA